MSCIEHYPDIHALDAPEQNARRKLLYIAIRHLLREQFSFDRDGSTAVEPSNFPGGFGKLKPRGATHPDLELDEKVLFASVYGLLLARNFEDPSFGRQLRGTKGPTDLLIVEGADQVLVLDRFVEALTQAVKDFNTNAALYQAVYRVLHREGATRIDPGGEPLETTVYVRQLAEVTERLIDERVDPANPQIRRLVLNALAQALGGVYEGNASQIDLSIPDLEVGTTIDILPDNVKAVGMLYFSAMLEEMKLFAVTEKVAEHFVTGMLPVVRGPAGERVFEWIKAAPDRFTEIERRSLYGRTLGVAQGAANEGSPNREFTDLWIRFLSSVAYLNREENSYLPTRVPAEMVHKSARDLAVNVSVHGFGLAHFAAVELQNLVRKMIDLLSAPEILSGYGVNDHWQLVERVSQLYLGGAQNGVRYRTTADAGAKVLFWLANKSSIIAAPVKNSATTETLFKDPELVGYVEQWLAVTGTVENTVQKFSEPVELRQQSTIPQMPGVGGSAQSALRSALDRVGVNGLPNVGNLPQA
jgi:hypothetical protein